MSILRSVKIISKIMGRICITIPDTLEVVITKESEDKAISKSDWITQASERFIRTRDLKVAQDCDEVRKELQDLKVTSATLTGEARIQELRIEELRKEKSLADGLVQMLMTKLMTEPQKLLPERAGFWNRVFGR